MIINILKSNQTQERLFLHRQIHGRASLFSGVPVPFNSPSCIDESLILFGIKQEVFRSDPVIDFHGPVFVDAAYLQPFKADSHFSLLHDPVFIQIQFYPAFDLLTVQLHAYTKVIPAYQTRRLCCGLQALSFHLPGLRILPCEFQRHAHVRKNPHLHAPLFLHRIPRSRNLCL